MKPYLLGNVPPIYKDVGLQTVAEPWQTDFRAETEAGNFLIGSCKNLLLLGPGAEVEARKWVACLIRGGFPAYRALPMEIARRMDGRVIADDNEERAEEFWNAETVLIDCFFTSFLGLSETSLLDWYMRERVSEGVCLILASDNINPNLDAQGSHLGALIETHFEVIKHGAEAGKKKTNIKPPQPARK